MTEAIEEMTEPLDDRAFHRFRQGCKLAAVNLRSEVGQYRCDVVDAAGCLRIAQEVESRQFDGRQLHGARVGFAFLDARCNGRNVLAVVENDKAAPARIFGRRLPVTTWNSITA